MALIIVTSAGGFQLSWSVLLLSFSEGENGKWHPGLSDFHHNYLLSGDCIQNSGKILICITLLKQIPANIVEF